MDPCFKKQDTGNCQSANDVVPGRATAAASRRGRAGPLWHRHAPQSGKVAEGREKETRGFAGACFRCLGPWGPGVRRACCHPLARLRPGWDRLSADRAGPIGRLAGAVAGARHGGAAIGFFLVVTTFFPGCASLCWWIPGNMALAGLSMQVNSWTWVRPFVAQAASWQGWKTGRLEREPR